MFCLFKYSQTFKIAATLGMAAPVTGVLHATCGWVKMMCRTEWSFSACGRNVPLGVDGTLFCDGRERHFWWFILFCFCLFLIKFSVRLCHIAEREWLGTGTIYITFNQDNRQNKVQANRSYPAQCTKRHRLSTGKQKLYKNRSNIPTECLNHSAIWPVDVKLPTLVSRPQHEVYQYRHSERTFQRWNQHSCWNQWKMQNQNWKLLYCSQCLQ